MVKCWLKTDISHIKSLGAYEMLSSLFLLKAVTVAIINNDIIITCLRECNRQVCCFVDLHACVRQQNYCQYWRTTFAEDVEIILWFLFSSLFIVNVDYRREWTCGLLSRYCICIIIWPRLHRWPDANREAWPACNSSCTSTQWCFIDAASNCTVWWQLQACGWWHHFCLDSWRLYKGFSLVVGGIFKTVNQQFLLYVN